MRRVQDFGAESGLALPIAEIQIRNLGGRPTFCSWPELQSLIAGQMYGSFAMATSYTPILGEQVG